MALEKGKSYNEKIRGTTGSTEKGHGIDHNHKKAEKNRVSHLFMAIFTPCTGELKVFQGGRRSNLLRKNKNQQPVKTWHLLKQDVLVRWS